MANLFIEKGEGCGLEILGTDAGSFPDAEELGEGEEGEAGGAGFGGSGGLVGEVEEEVGGGPLLWGWRGSDGLQGTCHGPVERGDGGWKEIEGFELANSGEEAAGGSGGAGMEGHVV